MFDKKAYNKEWHKKWLQTPHGKERSKINSKKYAQKTNYACSKRAFQKIKDLVYSHYGGYRCACCGETVKEFLSLDHIDNNGAQHRPKRIGHGCGKFIYWWAKRNGFPPILQVLCMNCNWGKRLTGVCPHVNRSIVNRNNDCYQLQTDRKPD